MPAATPWRAAAPWRAAGLALCVLLLWLMSAPTLAAPTFPKLTGRVVDDAQVLPPDVEAALTAKLAALEAANGTQLVVVTLPDLKGYDIGDYGYQLGRAWGIGQKGKDNGVLLAVFPEDRKMRIETGYGLEGALPDAVAGKIIEQEMAPAFRKREFAN